MWTFETILMSFFPIMHCQDIGLRLKCWQIFKIKRLRLAKNTIVASLTMSQFRRGKRVSPSLMWMFSESFKLSKKKCHGSQSVGK